MRKRATRLQQPAGLDGVQHSGRDHRGVVRPRNDETCRHPVPQRFSAPFRFREEKGKGRRRKRTVVDLGRPDDGYLRDDLVNVLEAVVRDGPRAGTCPSGGAVQLDSAVMRWGRFVC